MNVKIFLILILLFPLINSAYSTDISACQTISSSGYYRLTASITNSAADCFIISASNIELDLNGYTLDGNDGAFKGVKFNTNLTNISIKNGIISDWQYGLSNYNGAYRTNITLNIDNISFLSNNLHDIEFISATSSNLNISSTTFTGNLELTQLNNLNFNSSNGLNNSYGFIKIYNITNSNIDLKFISNLQGKNANYVYISLSYLKNVVVDLNGFTLTGAWSNDRAIGLSNVNNVTVKNGIISNWSYVFQNYNGVDLQTNINLTINNITTLNPYGTGHDLKFTTATNSNILIENVNLTNTIEFTSINSLNITNLRLNTSSKTSTFTTIPNVNINGYYTDGIVSFATITNLTFMNAIINSTTASTISSTSKFNIDVQLKAKPTLPTSCPNLNNSIKLKLIGNITNLASNFIGIYCSNVEIDLNGYNIDSTDANTFMDIVNNNLQNISIKNGIISDWNYVINEAALTNLTIKIENIDFFSNSIRDIALTSLNSSLNITNSNFSRAIEFKNLNSLFFSETNYINNATIEIYNITNSETYLKWGKNSNTIVGSGISTKLEYVSNVTVDFNGFNYTGANSNDRSVGLNTVNNISIKNGLINNWRNCIVNYNGAANLKNINLSIINLSLSCTYADLEFDQAGNSNLIIRDVFLYPTASTRPVYFLNLSSLNITNLTINSTVTSTFSTIPNFNLDVGVKVKPTMTNLNTSLNNTIKFKLIANITNQATSFFNVNWSNFEFDLNGYTLDGTTAANQPAILLSSNINNVTVKNGIIKEFIAAIKNNGNNDAAASWNENINLTVENLTEYTNTFGVRFSGSCPTSGCNGKNIIIQNSNLNSTVELNGSNSAYLFKNNFNKTITGSNITNFTFILNTIQSANNISVNATNRDFSLNLSTNFLGNRWGDFVCSNSANNYSVNYIGYTYSVCNSNDYTANSITDISPVFSFETKYFNLDLINYSEGIIYQNYTYLRVNSDIFISSCKLNWSSNLIDMNINGKYCEINKSDIYGNYNYSIIATSTHGLSNSTQLKLVEFKKPKFIYIYPTPSNNSNYAGNIKIKIYDISLISTYNISINGELSTAMTNLDPGYWEYNLENFEEITTFSINVTSNQDITETETIYFTFYPNYSTDILPLYSIFSGLVSLLLLIFGIIYINKK